METTTMLLSDTRPVPSAPTNVRCILDGGGVYLLWTPPPEPDYWYTEIWGSTQNERGTARLLGEASFYFRHDHGPTPQPWFYWLYAIHRPGLCSDGTSVRVMRECAIC